MAEVFVTNLKKLVERQKLYWDTISTDLSDLEFEVKPLRKSRVAGQFSLLFNCVRNAQDQLLAVESALEDLGHAVGR
jgi:hypothetical protein